MAKGHVQLIRPTSQAASSPSLLNQIGQKAVGLLAIPQEWRPPFFVLPAVAFEEWKTADGDRLEILKDVAETIEKAARQFESSWSAGLILRSSAIDESLASRGQFDSVPLAADFDASTISQALRRIFEQVPESEALAVIVQPFIPGPNRFLGHLSNERRVSKTVNQWMYETETHDWEGRFNSQRSSPTNPQKALRADLPKDLVKVFRSLGRWLTSLNRGPVHVEWAWCRGTLWLLQLDFEEECPDEGVDPRAAVSGIHAREDALVDTEPFTKVNLAAQRTGWRKVDGHSLLARIREDRYPDLFYVTGDRVRNSTGATLIAGIQSISKGRAVCRTDCANSTIGRLNLPRTHTVSATNGAEFIGQTIEDLEERGADDSEVCFIIHQFIPAVVAAWAYADPENQIVRVDSIWGLPDGLQFLPHDTFEYDIKRESVSAESLRYKPSFIQETESGSWNEIKVARKFGRVRSLPASAVAEVAQKSFELALVCREPVQVMWFCGIPAQLGIGENLPWFFMPAETLRVSPNKALGKHRKRFSVLTSDDLKTARGLPKQKYVLMANPDVELVRKDDNFINELAEIALYIGAPVELHGSILGHAYYTLQRLGVPVIAVGEPRYARTRGRQKFAKLVRDEIPSLIERGGERTVLTRLPKSQTRPALVAKLFEEANELLSAQEPSDVEAELADVLEVVRSLAVATGISWDDVVSTADTKRAQRGGFDRGVVLVETSWPKDGAMLEEREIVVPFSALANQTVSTEGIELNFAAILAGGKDSIITDSGGTKFRVRLSAKGLMLERVDESGTSEAQLRLPGLDA